MRLLKIICSIVCFIVGSAASVQGMEIKASQLISSCSSPKSDEQAFCIGYIGGVIDGARTKKKLVDRLVFRHPSSGKTWCASKEQNLIKATNKVVEFFQEDRISHSSSALMLVINALETKWTCNNK